MTNSTIVAAVHAGSLRLDDIVARSTARAEATDLPLVFLTVITKRPLSAELVRMRLRLARYTQPVHLVATRIDLADLDHRQRTNGIADELARAAVDLGANELVIGHDPVADDSRGDIAGRLTALLPPHITLRFGVSEAANGAQPMPTSGSNRSMQRLSPTYLTTDGRRRLAGRAAAIERTDLPRARQRLRHGNGGTAALSDYESTVHELRRLSSVLAHAGSTDDLPDDPECVELGEHITLALDETGQRRSLVVVDPIEALRGRACVSASSRLGRELLGNRVGGSVLVPTSHGDTKARIVSATRAASRT